MNTETPFRGQIVQVDGNAPQIPAYAQVVEISGSLIHLQAMVRDTTWDPPYKPDGLSSWHWLGHIGRITVVDKGFSGDDIV